MTPEQARALRESATNIIAHEKSLENEREKLVAEHEKASRSARQAVMMADEAARAGEADKTDRFNESAEALAQHIVELDSRIARIDIDLIEARQASQEAMSMASDTAIKAAQARSKTAELRAELHKAAAESTLDSTGTPSFDEVKDKIGDRLAKAEAEAELAAVDSSQSVDQHTALIEEAILDARAHAKLSEIRSAMGVEAPELVSTDTTDESE